jgi:hypothetical protein
MDARRTGEDMLPYVFSAAWRLADNYDDYVTLGGGEPTLSRHFRKIFKYLCDDITHDDDKFVLVITNGSRYRNTMLMIKEFERQRDYGDKEWLELEMSDPYDGYHDPSKVDYRIQAWFERHPRRSGSTYLQYTTPRFRRSKVVTAQGRGVNIPGAEPGCACEDRVVQPDGLIRVCGCKDAPIIGDVWEGYSDEADDYEQMTCWKEKERDDGNIEDCEAVPVLRGKEETDVA